MLHGGPVQRIPPGEELAADAAHLRLVGGRGAVCDANDVIPGLVGGGGGVYGILARDNAEAAFVNVDDITTGFYATRCYIKLSGGNTALLATNHIGADDGSTNVADLLTPGERVTVYNISGVPVATDATISDLNRLQPGIYTIKGKKVTISR